MNETDVFFLSARRRRMVLLLPLVVLGVVGAMALDQPIADFFRESGLDEKINKWTFLRWPGEYWLTFVCAMLLLVLHPQTWRAAGFMMLTGLAGFLNGVLKWVAGRSRPFKWADAWQWDFFHNGWPGAFSQKDLAFASGHVTQAFAWAAGCFLHPCHDHGAAADRINGSLFDRHDRRRGDWCRDSSRPLSYPVGDRTAGHGRLAQRFG